MNKFITISLCVAFALCAIADESSAPAQVPQVSDEQEVENLTDDKSALFGDFCLATRDFVTGDLRTKGLSLVPTTVMDLLSDTANRHKNIRARLNQIAENPSAELKKLDNFVAEQQRLLGQRISAHPFQASDLYNRARAAGEQARDSVRGFLKNPVPHLQKVDGLIAEQQRYIGQMIQNTPIKPVTFFKSAYEGLQAMANRIRSAPGTLALETCKAFERYEAEITKRFEEAKKELVSKDSSVSGMKLEDIQCATITRIRSVTSACDELKSLEKEEEEKKVEEQKVEEQKVEEQKE